MDSIPFPQMDDTDLSDEEFLDRFGVPRQDSYICVSCGKTAFRPTSDTDLLEPDSAHIQFIDDDAEPSIICWECLQDDDWEERARNRREEADLTSFTSATQAEVGIFQRIRRRLRAALTADSSGRDADRRGGSDDEVSRESASDRSDRSDLEWKLEQEREWAEYLERELQAKEDRLHEVQQELHQLRDATDDDVSSRPAQSDQESPLLATIFDVRDALASATSSAADSEFREGLVRIDQQLLDGLERVGVEQVATSGEADPHRHKVVETRPTAEQPPGTILETYRPGYRRDEAIFRPAHVAVAAEPRDDAGAGSGDEPAGDGSR